MKGWQDQRGDVPIGCLVGMVVLLAVVLVAIKVSPVIIASGEFEKEASVLADRANRRDYTDKRIQRDLLLKAEELDLPIVKKDISIKRTAKRIKIRITYDHAIEFPFYTYVWHKEIYEDRPLF